MQIKINKKKYTVKIGETILDVCRRKKIAIPTLCAFDGLPKEAVCRLCLVKTNRSAKLVTACTFRVCAGLEVLTESEKIQKARKINLELLWADHAGKCASCKKNKLCELQKLAEEYKIENFHFVPRKGEMTNTEEQKLLRDNWSRVVVENENACISRNSEFCVECRRCINICPEKKFGFNHRAGDVIVGTAYEKKLDCSFCGECVRVCPTAALTDQNNFSRIIEELDDLKKLSVAILDYKIEEKILEQLKKNTTEINLKKILFDLGFEKIIKLEKKDQDNADRIIKKIKTEYAQKEKIDPNNIRTFFISSQIGKKAEAKEYLDYGLSEREIARLVRDKQRIVLGKMRIN